MCRFNPPALSTHLTGALPPWMGLFSALRVPQLSSAPSQKFVQRWKLWWKASIGIRFSPCHGKDETCKRWVGFKGVHVCNILDERVHTIRWPWPNCAARSAKRNFLSFWVWVHIYKIPNAHQLTREERECNLTFAVYLTFLQPHLLRTWLISLTNPRTHQAALAVCLAEYQTFNVFVWNFAALLRVIKCLAVMCDKMWDVSHHSVLHGITLLQCG